jgi:cell division protein FtsB
METSDTALRPTQPPEPEAQLRWLMTRQAEALLAMAPVMERLTEAVEQLCRRIASLDANVADLEAKVAKLARV